MVRLWFSMGGRRREIVVPLWEAKWINRKLFREGAAVYWSERC
jgi:hypothetical protein